MGRAARKRCYAEPPELPQPSRLPISPHFTVTARVKLESICLTPPETADIRPPLSHTLSARGPWLGRHTSNRWGGCEQMPAGGPVAKRGRAASGDAGRGSRRHRARSAEGQGGHGVPRKEMGLEADR